MKSSLSRVIAAHFPSHTSPGFLQGKQDWAQLSKTFFKLILKLGRSLHVTIIFLFMALYSSKIRPKRDMTRQPMRAGEARASHALY